MTLYETIKAECEQARAEILAQLGDGFQFADVWPIVTACTMAYTRIAEATEAIGPDKKEAVLQALEALYAEVIAPLDLPGVPNLVVEPIVDKAIGALIRPCFDPLIEAVVSQFKLTGVLK